MARSGKEACVLGPIGLDNPELPGLGFSTKHLEKKRNYLERRYPTPAEIQGLCLHNPEGIITWRGRLGQPVSWQVTC